MARKQKVLDKLLSSIDVTFLYAAYSNNSRANHRVHDTLNAIARFLIAHFLIVPL